MKTYAIALKRSEERYDYIKQHLTELKLDYQVVDAVDGLELSEDDLSRLCNTKVIDSNRKWLSNGAIGCALSHQKVFKDIVQSNDTCALIVEDDVVLPINIKEIFSELEASIHPNEVILLFYVSKFPAKLSRVGSTRLKNGGLYYPLDIGQTISSAAYVIGKQAAKNMQQANQPIEVTPDAWKLLYQKGAFSSLRVYFPSPIVVKNFKSSIDYVGRGSLKHAIAMAIDKFRIPVAYQLVTRRRQRALKKTRNHFSLTDEHSSFIP